MHALVSLSMALTFWWRCYHSEGQRASRGFLANGNQIVMHTHVALEEGSHVVVRMHPLTGTVTFLVRNGGCDDLLVGVLEGPAGVVGEVCVSV